MWNNLENLMLNAESFKELFVTMLQSFKEEEEKCATLGP
jgi:hypothetical protein